MTRYVVKWWTSILIYDNFVHHTAGSTLYFTATQNLLSHRRSVGGLRRLSTGWIKVVDIVSHHFRSGMKNAHVKIKVVPSQFYLKRDHKKLDVIVWVFTPC